MERLLKMIKAIRHTGLVVANLKESIKFWTEVMDFQVIQELQERGKHIDKMIGLENIDVTTVKLSAQDGNKLELLYFKSHKDKSKWQGFPYTTGFTHIALTVDNIENQIDRIKSFGINFSTTPQKSIDGKVKVAYVKGPEAILIELVEQIN